MNQTTSSAIVLTLACSCLSNTTSTSRILVTKIFIFCIASRKTFRKGYMVPIQYVYVQRLLCAVPSAASLAYHTWVATDTWKCLNLKCNLFNSIANVPLSQVRTRETSYMLYSHKFISCIKWAMIDSRGCISGGAKECSCFKRTESHYFLQSMACTDGDTSFVGWFRACSAIFRE